MDINCQQGTMQVGDGFTMVYETVHNDMCCICWSENVINWRLLDYTVSWLFSPIYEINVPLTMMGYFSTVSSGPSCPELVWGLFWEFLTNDFPSISPVDHLWVWVKRSICAQEPAPTIIKTVNSYGWTSLLRSSDLL